MIVGNQHYRIGLSKAVWVLDEAFTRIRDFLPRICPEFGGRMEV
jgi:hypothetical protein